MLRVGYKITGFILANQSRDILNAQMVNETDNDDDINKNNDNHRYCTLSSSYTHRCIIKSQ